MWTTHGSKLSSWPSAQPAFSGPEAVFTVRGLPRLFVRKTFV